MSDNYPEFEEIKAEAEKIMNEAENAAKDVSSDIEEKAEEVKEAVEDKIPEQTFTVPEQTFTVPEQTFTVPEQKFTAPTGPETHSFTYGRTPDNTPPRPQNFGGQYAPQNAPRFAPQQDRQNAYGAPQYGGGQFAQQPQYGQGQYGGQNFGQQSGAQYYGEQPYGGSRGGYYGQNVPPAEAKKEEKEKKEKKKKEKKEKKAATKGFAVLMALLTILLSCAAGAAGAYVFGKISKGNGGADGTAVMYRSVETKTKTSDVSVAAVADTVSDSVVEITTEFVTTGYFSFGQYVNKGAGSGVIITDDGYIVTNNHVIADTDNGNVLASKIAVRLRNGEEYPAEVVGRDGDADIAVIKIKADNLSAAVWGDSESLAVGEQIVVVGNPLGELGGTVTTGIVSASDREIKIDETKMSLIQTDAAVNPGNSGGGMFNFKGELVGIVNAKSSGTGIEGLGFAIPSNDAKDVVEQLLEFGYVKGKVYLGISFYEANMGGWFSDSTSGVLYVYSCEEGYNDDVLQYGDQVIAVDGSAVSTKADVKAILQGHKVGDTLTFTILRQGKTKDVTVTCYEYTPSEKDINFGN